MDVVQCWLKREGNTTLMCEQLVSLTCTHIEVLPIGISISVWFTRFGLDWGWARSHPNISSQIMCKGHCTYLVRDVDECSIEKVMDEIIWTSRSTNVKWAAQSQLLRPMFIDLMSVNEGPIDCMTSALQSLQKRRHTTYPHSHSRWLCSNSLFTTNFSVCVNALL